jgi:hypothetical protein
MADIHWEMGKISTAWDNAWILPAMAYDVIVGTDWMEKHNPHINFKE